MEVEDFDDDGQLDLFSQAMAEWPSANILSGDDQGNDELFRKRKSYTSLGLRFFTHFDV